MRFFLAGFGLLAIFDTATQVCFKLTAARAGEFALQAEWLRAAAVAPSLYVAIAGYLAAFVTWMTLLRHVPVGPAFAVSHIDVVTVLLISIPLFNEHVSFIQLVGAAFIVAGIAVLSRSRDSAAPPAAS